MTLLADLDRDDVTELAVAVHAYIRARTRALQPVRPATRRVADLLTAAAKRTEPQTVERCGHQQHAAPMDDVRNLTPVAFTVPEVAHITTLSERKVAELVADGRLPSVKVDGRRLVRRVDLDAFLAAHLTTSGLPA